MLPTGEEGGICAFLRPPLVIPRQIGLRVYAQRAKSENGKSAGRPRGVCVGGSKEAVWGGIGGGVREREREREREWVGWEKRIREELGCFCNKAIHQRFFLFIYPSTPGLGWCKGRERLGEGWNGRGDPGLRVRPGSVGFTLGAKGERHKRTTLRAEGRERARNGSGGLIHWAAVIAIPAKTISPRIASGVEGSERGDLLTGCDNT
ncbi:hypothetical protein GGS23DRAFT_68666 [Durotheca rogersii]|uniref:uncharacterized protein n=1 Tax=Durotheca rogersii TaxID=419775 RepID=UPI0022202467|nr:uncharacterized protein GGS23DRAFT_68666 [Durotheca rogersii]KAI5862816.1 hypothetical protein GGS23DRAFT_68666 [Durotheca rogersii]